MSSHDDSAGLEAMFEHIDKVFHDDLRVQVQVTLRNASLMAIRAGGRGTHSWPESPPFMLYEVLVSEEPPRFWTKYADSNSYSVYDKVPKLLICHHIIHSGGMFELVFETLHKHAEVIRI